MQYSPMMWKSKMEMDFHIIEVHTENRWFNGIVSCHLYSLQFVIPCHRKRCLSTAECYAAIRWTARHHHHDGHCNDQRVRYKWHDHCLSGPLNVEISWGQSTYYYGKIQSFNCYELILPLLKRIVLSLPESMLRRRQMQFFPIPSEWPRLLQPNHSSKTYHHHVCSSYVFLYLLQMFHSFRFSLFFFW